MPSAYWRGHFSEDEPLTLRCASRPVWCMYPGESGPRSWQPLMPGERAAWPPGQRDDGLLHIPMTIEPYRIQLRFSSRIEPRQAWLDFRREFMALVNTLEGHAGLYDGHIAVLWRREFELEPENRYHVLLRWAFGITLSHAPPVDLTESCQPFSDYLEWMPGDTLAMRNSLSGSAHGVVYGPDDCGTKPLISRFELLMEGDDG